MLTQLVNWFFIDLLVFTFFTFFDYGFIYLGFDNLRLFITGQPTFTVFVF